MANPLASFLQVLSRDLDVSMCEMVVVSDTCAARPLEKTRTAKRLKSLSLSYVPPPPELSRWQSYPLQHNASSFAMISPPAYPRRIATSIETCATGDDDDDDDDDNDDESDCFELDVSNLSNPPRMPQRRLSGGDLLDSDEDDDDHLPSLNFHYGDGKPQPKLASSAPSVSPVGVVVVPNESARITPGTTQSIFLPQQPSMHDDADQDLTYCLKGEDFLLEQERLAAEILRKPHFFVQDSVDEQTHFSPQPKKHLRSSCMSHKTKDRFFKVTASAESVC